MTPATFKSRLVAAAGGKMGRKRHKHRPWIFPNVAGTLSSTCETSAFPRSGPLSLPLSAVAVIYSTV